eukprot:Gb_31129 [translate_table: standard]
MYSLLPYGFVSLMLAPLEWIGMEDRESAMHHILFAKWGSMEDRESAGHHILFPTLDYFDWIEMFGNLGAPSKYLPPNIVLIFEWLDSQQYSRKGTWRILIFKQQHRDCRSSGITHFFTSSERSLALDGKKGTMLREVMRLLLGTMWRANSIPRDSDFYIEDTICLAIDKSSAEISAGVNLLQAAMDIALVGFIFMDDNGADSKKKFPSKSCPLRYGKDKISQDALHLFERGLREYCGGFVGGKRDSQLGSIRNLQLHCFSRSRLMLLESESTFCEVIVAYSLLHLTMFWVLILVLPTVSVHWYSGELLRDKSRRWPWESSVEREILLLPLSLSGYVSWNVSSCTWVIWHAVC